MILARLKVSDLSEQVRGVSYGKEDASNVPKEDYVPILRAGNITDNGLTFNDLVFVPAKRVSEKQMIRRHDVVIAASSGSLDIVGKAAPALSDFVGSFGAFCKVLRPNSKVHPSYFANFFQTCDYRRKISALAAGANINNLRNEHLDNLELPLPPIAEQKRIAEILDCTQSLISKRKEAIAKLDTLIQSIFIEMFGDPITNPKRWNSRTLEEIAIKITDGEHLNPDFSLGGMPIVMAGNVLEDFVDIQNAKKVDITLGEKFRKKCSPERGDILLVSRGATIGRLCTVDFSDDFCLMGSVILIKLNHFSVESKYLKSLLKQPLMYAKLFNTSGSSAQQAIYLKDLKHLICLLPPLPLQKEFAQRVEAVEKLKATHRVSLSQLQALFASLQHRAFRGEL